MKALLLILSFIGVRALATEYVPSCRVAVYESGATLDYTYVVHKDDLSGLPLPMKLGFSAQELEGATRPYLLMSASPTTTGQELNFHSTIHSSKDEQGTATMQIFFSRTGWTNATELHVRLQRAPGQQVWNATFTEVDAQRHQILGTQIDVQMAENDGILAIPFSGTVNMSWSCRVP